jgi:DNA repair exonuclease SbcCD ATPase subunit
VNNYISVGDVKHYLPTSIKLNKAQPKVPVISDSTVELFSKIQPCLPNSNTFFKTVTPLNQSISDLKEASKRLEEAKKTATLHKCLSLLSIAAWVTIIAAVVLAAVFVNPLIGLGIGVLGGVLVGGSSGAFLHQYLSKITDKNRGQKHYEDSEASATVSFFLGMLSLGLSVPIHYAVHAFRRVPDLEKRISSLGNEAKKNHEKIKEYLSENYGLLHKTLSQDLEDKKNDLVSLNKIKTPMEVQKNELKAEISKLTTSLEQLEAAKAFYDTQ